MNNGKELQKQKSFSFQKEESVPQIPAVLEEIKEDFQEIKEDQGESPLTWKFYQDFDEDGTEVYQPEFRCSSSVSSILDSEYQHGDDSSDGLDDSEHSRELHSPANTGRRSIKHKRKQIRLPVLRRQMGRPTEINTIGRMDYGCSTTASSDGETSDIRY